MVNKYIIRDFHPLIFFYLLGALLLFLDIPLAVRLLYKYIETGHLCDQCADYCFLHYYRPSGNPFCDAV